MSNDSTKKWAEEQRKREAQRERDRKPACLHCGAPVTDGSALCGACD